MDPLGGKEWSRSLRSITSTAVAFVAFFAATALLGPSQSLADPDDNTSEIQLPNGCKIVPFKPVLVTSVTTNPPSYRGKAGAYGCSKGQKSFSVYLGLRVDLKGETDQTLKYSKPKWSSFTSKYRFTKYLPCAIEGDAESRGIYTALAFKGQYATSARRQVGCIRY